ncbi:MAG: GlxA family transcriptional regulator [Pseudomonadota bacterium]
MSLRRRQAGATELRILVTPNFNLAATMNVIDPFRVSNYLEGKTLFRWRFISEAGGLVVASNGTGIETEIADTGDVAQSDFVLVSSSWEPEAHATPAIRSVLREAARNGASLGGLDTGAFVLAYAGLLAGYRATVHYEHMDAFQELFPDTDLSDALWEFDRRRMTCCGGAASLEFALHIIKELHGSALANSAARYIFAPALRGHDVRQSPVADPLGHTVPESVRSAIRVMEDNLEIPLPISELCTRVGLSHRQLNRVFALHVRKTPALYYRDIRLDRARGLVTQTGLSMSEIAVASGFSSQVHFSRAYRDRFGLAPSKDRSEGRVPFEFRAWPMHRAPSGAAKIIK